MKNYLVILLFGIGFSCLSHAGNPKKGAAPVVKPNVNSSDESQLFCEGLFVGEIKPVVLSSLKAKMLQKKIAKEKAEANRVWKNKPTVVTPERYEKEVEDFVKLIPKVPTQALRRAFQSATSVARINRTGFLSAVKRLPKRDIIRVLQVAPISLSADELKQLGLEKRILSVRMNPQVVALYDAKRDLDETEKEVLADERVQVELAAESAPNHTPATDEINEELFNLFQDTLTQFNTLIGRLGSKEYSFLSSFDREQKRVQVQSQTQMTLEIFDQWVQSSQDDLIDRLLHQRIKKMHSIQEELSLLKARSNSYDFTEIAKENKPELIVPHRSYELTFESGEKMKVRFSKKIVDDIMWNSHNSGMREVAEATLDVLSRGWSKTKAGQGLHHYKIEGFEKEKPIVKLQYVGHAALGATRLFGVLDGDTLYITHWEREGQHDKKYIQVACDKTLRRFETENWNLPEALH